MPNISIQESVRIRRRRKAKLSEPRLFNVVIFNDEQTPMDFVTAILIKVFGLEQLAAETVMQQVHQSGTGVAGTYPYDIAEAKVSETRTYAQRLGYPLHCSAQPEPDRHD